MILENYWEVGYMGCPKRKNTWDDAFERWSSVLKLSRYENNKQMNKKDTTQHRMKRQKE